MNKRLDIKGHLSQRQIKTYVNGLLEREENHAVEDHLLHCDLCSDAVEGYQKFPNAEIPAQEQFDVIGQSNNWQIRRIAAVVALLISLGMAYWAINQFSSDSESITTLSQEDNATQKEVTEQEEKVEEFSLLTPLTDTGKSITEHEEKSVAVSNSSTSDNVLPAPKTNVQQAESLDLEIEVMESEAIALAQQDKPPAIANIKVPVLQEEIGHGRIQESLADEGFIADGTTKEFYGQEAKDEKKTARQKAAKSKISTAGNREPMTITKQNTADIMPQEGWEAFNQYIEANIGTCGDSTVAQRSSVVLQIAMEAKDQKPEILVVKGINERCNEMAIKLIKEGPKWVIINNNTQPGPHTAIVTVNFKLD